MSFCIMFTSNQASSGISSTNDPRYFSIGEAMRFEERLDGDLPVDSVLLGEQQALAEGDHLHLQAQVDGDLHQQGLAVRADVQALGADVEQDRLDSGEGVLAAPDHDRELSPPRGC